MASTICWEMRLDASEPGGHFSSRLYSFCKDWLFVVGPLRAAGTESAPVRRRLCFAVAI